MKSRFAFYGFGDVDFRGRGCGSGLRTSRDDLKFGKVSFSVGFRGLSCGGMFRLAGLSCETFKMKEGAY